MLRAARILEKSQLAATGGKATLRVFSDDQGGIKMRRFAKWMWILPAALAGGFLYACEADDSDQRAAGSASMDASVDMGGQGGSNDSAAGTGGAPGTGGGAGRGGSEAGQDLLCTPDYGKACGSQHCSANLQYEIAFFSATPIAANEKVTYVVTVTNSGATAEGFHIVFSQQGLTPFYTSPKQIIAPGVTKKISTEVACLQNGAIAVCADLACDPLLSIGVQQYPADHYWSIPVDTLPLDPKSSTYIAKADGDCPNGCNIAVNGGSKLNWADSTTPKQRLTSIEAAWRSDDIPYPIPENAQTHWSSNEAGLWILNWEEGKFYEMYNPIPAPDGGTWSADSAMAYDFSSYALRPDNRTSISASGMPTFPGLIRYEEVEAGEIRHAMNVHMYTSQDTHIWAARAGGVRSDPSYPPLGQRFRLRASFDISGFPQQEQVILKAFKKYGIVLQDQNLNEDAWTVHSFDDPRWNLMSTNYHHFDPLKATDFEAVDMSSVMIDIDSGQCRTP